MSNSLYELNQDFQKVLSMVYNEEIDEDAIFDTLEGIEGEIEDKADGYAAVIAELNGDSDKLKAEIERLSKRKKALDNRAARMKDSLEAVMKDTGKVDFRTTLHSFKIQKNPASVVIDNELEVPSAFMLPVVPKYDKKAIKAAIEDGQEVPGCRLEVKEGLRIR